MKIWSLQEDVDVYEHITLVNGNNEKWIQFGELFNGKPLGDTWKPLHLKLIEHGGKLKKGDMPYLSPGVPVFSKNAKETLNDLMESRVEILEVNYVAQELYVINVTNLISAIDYEKVDIKYMPDGKRILRFRKYAFIKEKVQNQHIFKIVEQPRADVFISDEFRNKVIESGIEGFKFVEVWDSER